MVFLMRSALVALLALPAAGTLLAQAVPADADAQAWHACTQLPESVRLTCFDDWAARQPQPAPTEARPAVNARPGEPTSATDGLAATSGPPAPRTDDPELVDGPRGIIAVGLEQGCRDRSYTQMSRFWELEAGSSCPPLGLRAFRTNVVALAASSRINRQPQSPNPDNSAATTLPYQRQEMRVRLSIRTKLASGILTPAGSHLRDSLWLAYSQQSYWQVFNGAVSRPFRNTDYQPEIIYIYPTTLQLPGKWWWRYSGLGIAHESNGQSDPLSRSWNHAYLMAGFERGDRLNLELRAWKRIPESRARDDNPDLTRQLGHGDVSLLWRVNTRNALRTTVTGSPRRVASTRLEWMHALGPSSGLRIPGMSLHVGLFHGRGDSLLDYNFKRTVFTLGLSLSDF